MVSVGGEMLRLVLTDDLVATYVSFVLMVGYCITAAIGMSQLLLSQYLYSLYLASKYGAGNDQWEVSPKDLTSFFKVSHQQYAYPSRY